MDPKLNPASSSSFNDYQQQPTESQARPNPALQKAGAYNTGSFKQKKKEIRKPSSLSTFFSQGKKSP